jgi:branched-chain amino acid transport system substrate-binding protein
MNRLTSANLLMYRVLPAILPFPAGTPDQKDAMHNAQSVRTSLSRLGLAVLLAWTAGCAGGEGPGDVVRFGVATPLEQFIGARTLRGAELARDEINAAGGLRGRTLELVAVSDSASAHRAVAVADGFLKDPAVVAVVGHSTSGATLAAATIYNQGLVAVSPTATSPEITGAGDWIFRIAASDAVNSARLASFALRELGSRAAILYANEPYGRGLREGFGRAFLAGGGTLLDEYPYIEGETQDFEAYLLGIRAARPDLIFIAGLDVSAGLIIRQARALGIEAPIIGGDGLLGLVGQDSVFDGTYVGLLYHPDVPGQAGRRFVEAYRSAYGEQPDHFAALTYDATMLLADAVREVGFDRAKIRDYLAEVGSGREPFRGVSGLIAFDENGDPLQKGYAVGRISGGGIELVSVEGGT